METILILFAIAIVFFLVYLVKDIMDIRNSISKLQKPPVRKLEYNPISEETVKKWASECFVKACTETESAKIFFQNLYEYSISNGCGFDQVIRARIFKFEGQNNFDIGLNSTHEKLCLMALKNDIFLKALEDELKSTLKTK